MQSSASFEEEQEAAKRPSLPNNRLAIESARYLMRESRRPSPVGAARR